MTGKVVSLSTVGDHDAVTVVVGIQAFYTGQAEFVVEPTDPLRDGFLLR
jgi:trans-L-3-hydroxyproline dehydratase